MPTFINPMEAFDDLVGFFEIAADEGGIALDAVLCRSFADGLADLAEKFEALVGFARASGCVETIAQRAGAYGARTTAERLELARLAVVIRGNVYVVPAFDGGTAA